MKRALRMALIAFLLIAAAPLGYLAGLTLKAALGMP